MKYSCVLSVMVMTGSLCNGMSTVSAWDKQRDLRKKFISQRLDEKTLDHFEEYASSGLRNLTDRWPDARRKIQQARGFMRLLQERLRCYPDYAQRDFVGQDDEYNASRDQMDALVSAISAAEITEIESIKNKLKACNFDAITDAEINRIREINGQYDPIRKVEADLKDYEDLWLKTTITMKNLIDKKEKKCVVM